MYVYLYVYSSQCFIITVIICDDKSSSWWILMIQTIEHTFAGNVSIYLSVVALSIAFGCLYRDDFTIEPVDVCGVMAAASLLQLDGLMQQCSAIMVETCS